MADYIYTAPYTYNGVTYNRGDALVVTGNYYYTATSTSASGSVTNETKYFYGYCTYADGTEIAHPLGLMNSASHSSVTFAQMDMSAIQSGGTQASYTVTINMNGGTANGVSSMTVTVGTNGWYTFGNNIPTRTGYTFKGLYTAASGGEQIYFENGVACGDGTYWEAYQVGDGTIGYRWLYAGNVTLYAQWTPKTYTVKYNANGGSGTMSNSTATYNANFMTRQNAFTKTGYTFNGWNEKADGTGTAWSLTGNGVYESGKSWKWVYTSGITLYAQWKENRLTVNYYSNYATNYNGTSTPKNTVNNNNVLIWTQDYYYDNEYSSGLNNYSSGSTLGMIRTGYTATGNWGTSTSGGTLVHQDTGFATGQALAQALGKTLASGNANVNVYAQWTPNQYIITYNANGGSGGTTQTVSYGTSWITKGAICTKDGYTHTSWNTSPDGTGTTYSLNAGQTNKQLSDLTLYAIYTTDNYVVHFDAGRGLGNIDDMSYSYGITYTLPTSGVYFNAYKLIGWNTKPNGTGTMYNFDINISDKIEGNEITLYAIWEFYNCSIYNGEKFNNGILYIYHNGKWCRVDICSFTNNEWLLTGNSYLTMEDGEFIMLDDELLYI